MRFFTTFSRYKTTVPPGSIALGADSVPTAQPNVSMDNKLSTKFNSINGFPTQRIALAYIAPSGVLALNVSLYVWEDLLQAWLLLGGATTISPGGIAYWDAPAVLEQPATDNNLNTPTSGAFDIVAVITDPGSAPSGQHKFALAPVLTTSP